MADFFKEYVQDEISEMLREIGPYTNTGSKRFTGKAMAWIEKNAADFRIQWDKKNKKIVGCKRKTQVNAV
jgi:hypothetical protein